MGLTLVFTESATLTASTPASAVVTITPANPPSSVDVSYFQPATVDLATGLPGPGATITVGLVTTLAAGSNATVNNVGTSTNAVFDFGIPQGVKGDTGTAATISVGTTTTGAAGSSATVTNSGTSSAAVFNFTIPQGIQGIQGPVGPAGSTGVVAATAPLSYNSGTQTISIDLSAYATTAYVGSNFYPLSSNPAGYITSSALTGYATQSWVTSQGYLTSSALSPYLLSSVASTTYAPIAAKVPTGGTTGQVLSKVSGTNYDLAWTTPSSGGGAVWGSITGTLSSQTDLQTALNGKYSTSNPAGYITSSALSPYLTSATASATYLTIANAATSYAPIAAAVPTGGSTGQVLTKLSGSNYALSWTTPAVGDKYYTTSTTSLSVGNGNKSLTVATGLSYTTQQSVIIAHDAANHMHGVVTSYNSSTGAMVVDVAQHTGSGTYTSWTVNVGGISSVAEWGLITGTLSNQTDLQTALNAKLDVTTAASTYQPIGSYITDAPSDGTPYVRQDGAWLQLNIT